jgi:predicted regulator of Ras-like GTPase activity (Roadblock/LC7/MglB family)
LQHELWRYRSNSFPFSFIIIIPMRRFLSLIAAVGVTLAVAGGVQAQNRNFGARTFTMDDGTGRTYTLQTPGSPGGMPGVGNFFYSMPVPPPGNPPAGFVNVGTLAGQTLFWNGTNMAWEASSIITNNTNGNGTNVTITAPIAATSTLGVTGLSVLQNTTWIKTATSIVNGDNQAVALRVTAPGSSWTGAGAFGGALSTVIVGEIGGNATIGAHNNNLSGWQNLFINPVAGVNVRIGSITAPANTLDVTGTLGASGAVTFANLATAGIVHNAAGGLLSTGAVNLASNGAGGDVTGVLAIANGGTGSAVQNFVDLTTAQTVGGAKTFTAATTANTFASSGATITGGNITGTPVSGSTGGFTTLGASTSETFSNLATAGLVHNAAGGALSTSLLVNADITPLTIQNGSLQNSSITVTGGTGLGVAGSPVSLGGTVTLSNTGVTSNVAGNGITVSGATGAVTITNAGQLSTASNVLFAASGPQSFSTSGSVTLNPTLSTQAANTVLAGPSAGPAAAPTFRSLVAADIPAGSASYIQNQNAGAQAAANFWISGNGRVGTTLTAGGDISTSGGNVVLPQTTSAAVGNVYFGANRTLHVFGNNNLFVGGNAGNYTMSGTNNVASGPNDLQSISSGSQNTATGAYAMVQTTTGSNNTATGYNAMNQLGGGSDNTAVGNQAGIGVTTGSQNTAIGSNANVTGNPTNATAIGYGATNATLNSIQLGNGSVTLVNTSGSITSTGLNATAGTIQTTGALNVGTAGSETFGNLNVAGGIVHTTGAGLLSSSTLSAADVASAGTLSNNTTGTSSGFTGNLAGDVTGPQGTTAIAGTLAAGNHIVSAINAANTNISNTGISVTAGAGSFTNSTTSLPAALSAANTAPGGVGITSYGAFISSGGGNPTGTNIALTLTAANAGTNVALNVTGGDITMGGHNISGGGTVTAAGFNGPLTGNVTGNVSGSSASFTGNLVGDVTGTQGATVVSTVGTSTAANVHTAELAANAATALNTASTIVKRDASGNFTAGTITAALTGNVTGNVSGSSASFTGNLVGDVTGTQGATVVSTVGTSTAANVHTAELAANAATALNTASTIVKRDASGNFAASAITSTGLNATAGTIQTTGTVSTNVVSATGSNPWAAQVATTATANQTIANSNVSATGPIIVTYEEGTGTAGLFQPYVSSRVAGVSFTITWLAAPPAGSFINYILIH